MKFRVLLFLLFIGKIVFAQTPILHLSLDEASGAFANEAISNSSFIINNEYPNPEAERVVGVSGNAIRLNGYATYIQGDLSNQLPTNAFSISLWFALESYPVNSGGLFSRFNDSENRGFKIELDRYGYPKFKVSTNSTVNEFTLNQPVEKFQWHHLVWTINTANQKMYVYLNGNEVANKNLAGSTLLSAANADFLIGKNTTSEMVGIFNTQHLNGIVDEIKIYNSALTSSEVQTIFNENQTSEEPDLKIPTTRFENDFHRGCYHAIPDAGWTNEPHGLIYYDGEYHFTYQKNANGPYWSQINWGHQSSLDLIQWVDHKPILSPEPGDDEKGIWSGHSVLDDNGNPFIMYTGVDFVTAQMMVATSPNNDYFNFEKFPNPVVTGPPAPYTAMDFRDPYLWKHDGSWYMIIGTGLGAVGNSGGAVLLFKSTNLYNWTYIEPMKKGFPADDDTGGFWEMPVFFQKGDKWVLLVNPVPTPQKPARMLYWTGTFENDEFTPDYLIPKLLGNLKGMLAPMIFNEDNGRTVAMGIIPDLLPAEEQRKNGWAHLYSLPREWYLSDDGETLLQKPIEELKKLRGVQHNFQDVNVSAGASGFLPNISGRQLEIRATIEKGTATKVGFVVAKTPDNSEFTKVEYDFLFDFVQFDRVNSTTNTSAPRSPLNAPLVVPNDEDLVMDLFLDGSVLEVFINDAFAYSARIFPDSEESIYVDLFAEGGTANFKTVDVWEMYCKDQADLINDVNDLKKIENQSFIKNVFPNPSDGAMTVQFDLDKSRVVEFYVYDLLGKKVNEFSLGKKSFGEHSFELNNIAFTNSENTQMYFLEMRIDNVPMQVEKIIFQK